MDDEDIQGWQTDCLLPCPAPHWASVWKFRWPATVSFAADNPKAKIGLA